MSSCPSDQTLARLGDDSPDRVEWTAVEVHVQNCEKCVVRLEKLLSHESARATATASLPAEEHLPKIRGFDIDGEIGRGGMGVVYRAWETKLARTVALKIVPSGPMTGSRERRRWLAEARCVTRVCHPNIVQIHDAGEADGWLYLVLEFVLGESLKERLRGPLPPRAAAELMRPVAAAMSAVHAAGLLHLDLKPSNILLESALDASWKDASPKVADFGIARPLADLDASSSSLAGPWGTPSYMAPEQAIASRAGIGAAADIYALGAIIYELLTGRPPFQGTSTLETLDQVRGQKPVPPRRLNPKIPRDLETIALKCLEKNPSRRYGSADALADDLNRFLEGHPIKARPVSPIEHAWRWCRRQPAIAALAAILFLTLIGSFLGLLALLRRSEANYQVASRSLNEILRILPDDIIFIQMWPPGHEPKHTLEFARSQEIELSKRNPSDVGSLKRLAMIDRQLANFRLLDRKPEEAQSLVEESIGSCDRYLALSPDDVEIQWKRFEAAAWTAMTLASSENEQPYQRWNARALAMLEQLKSHDTVHVAGVSGITRCHRFHADSLMSRGETDRARIELEMDLAFVGSVPATEIVFPEIVLCEALALAALGRGTGELSPVQSPIPPQPANVAIRNLERDLAELTARRIGFLPSIVKSRRLIPEDLSSEAWAERVISSIKTDAAKFHLDHTRIPLIGWRMRDFSHETLAWQRRVGKLGDARRGADRALALAHRLTQTYPDQAAAYMILSDGYVQRAKIAYRVDDEPVIGWEQKALDAANRAATLDPENYEARGIIENRRARLNKLAPK
jgi:eukaryotic-like serine/threonine-protein kinase